MAYGIKDLGCNFLGIRSDTNNLRKDEFWALKDINFEIKKGEAVGLIGVNGCGKSTLLRLITGIYPPDSGEINIRGNVGALIALGAGFHPHMTGRENIYINGTILGMQNNDIDAIIDAIIDFAEVGEFIDAPVSTYSSGMRVRLGFAVAVQVKPEVLLIDEVLAVGDISFQNKCIRHLRNLLRDDRSIIFVSHSMANVRRICSRGILMNHGKILADGDLEPVIGEYLKLTNSSEIESDFIGNKNNSITPVVTYSSDLARIIGMTSMNEESEEVDSFMYREDLVFLLTIDVLKTIYKPWIELLIYCPSLGVMAARTRVGKKIDSLESGRYKFRISCVDIGLTPGTYAVHATVFDENTVLSMIENISIINITPVPDMMNNTGGFFTIDTEIAYELDLQGRLTDSPGDGAP